MIVETYVYTAIHIYESIDIFVMIILLEYFCVGPAVIGYSLLRKPSRRYVLYFIM